MASISPGSVDAEPKVETERENTPLPQAEVEKAKPKKRKTEAELRGRLKRLQVVVKRQARKKPSCWPNRKSSGPKSRG